MAKWIEDDVLFDRQSSVVDCLFTNSSFYLTIAQTMSDFAADRPTGYPGNLTPEQTKVFGEFKTALSRRFSSPTYDDIPVRNFMI